MKLYSYKGNEPEELPFSIFLDGDMTESGLRETRTSLYECSDEELLSFGFSGPYTKPEYNDMTHKLVWNQSEYSIVELNEQEKQERIRIQSETKGNNTLERDTFKQFFDRFIESSLFIRIKNLSLSNLESNVIFTEIYSSLSAAISGEVNNYQIQNWINAVYFKFVLTNEEKTNFYKILEDLNLHTRYTIPSDSILSTHEFDFSTNTIKEPSPFPSWEWTGKKWTAPEIYPNDGYSYIWNEEEKKWVRGSYM